MTGPRVTAGDLAGLRRAAEAATPGPWREMCMGSEGYHVLEVNPSGPTKRPRRVASCTYEAWEFDKANAEFIAAANPATVLALLDDLAAAQTQLAAVRTLAESLYRADNTDPYQLAKRIICSQIRAALAEGPAPETTP